MQHQQYAEEQGLLGLLCPGQKKLEGKTFYLDNIKKRSTAMLLESISLLGGRVESFLHKDVSFVVTASQECLKDQKCTDSKSGMKGTSDEAKRPIMTRESLLSNDKRRPGTPRPVACGSRGKALLEKAIRNNERLQKSSVLTNAQSWGVKILYVDDVLLYLKQLSFSVTYKRSEKTCTKQQSSHVVKATPLRSPYLKIEDLSRKYKPLHMQSMTFPTLWHSGRFSPFECPPPQFEKRTEQGENEKREKKNSNQDKSLTPLSCNPSPWRPRKKDLSYCECCHQPFTNLDMHLQSDQHRAFVLDLSNYSMVDQLVAKMLPGFNPDPPQQSEETLVRPPTPLLIQDTCELETLTDAETEDAVQALQRQGSTFIVHISSPARAPPSCGPASPSSGLQFPIPSPATPPADIQPPTTTDTDCQNLDSHPCASSPAMPLLDVEPMVGAYNSASHQPDTRHLFPCPDMPCLSPDPCSLPPVLSPQVPYPSYIMEPHSPYSEPPVLSPQQYVAEEAVEAHTCEMDTAESVFQSFPAVTIPTYTPLIPSVALTNAEGAERQNQDSLLGFSGINGFECAAPFSHSSLPRQSVTAPNFKKRCRSANPKHTRSKRRRIIEEYDCSGSWTEQMYKSAEPERDIMAKSEGCLSSDEVSCQILPSCPNPKITSTCAVDMLGLEQTLTTCCVPTVQNQMGILGHGHTSVASCQPLWPLSLTAMTFDPPFQSPIDKSHSTFCSQDSKLSQSHSTSVCIESALIPDLGALSSSSSQSDWDCDLLSRLGPTSAAPVLPHEQNCELDKELLHRPCTYLYDASYESRLHTALQPATPGTSLCGEEMDPSAFSRTVVQIVEVQH